MLGKKGDVIRFNTTCPTCEKTVINVGRGDQESLAIPQQSFGDCMNMTAIAG
jgi:hypothetical protein